MISKHTNMVFGYLIWAKESNYARLIAINGAHMCIR
jgi:hypothetical protein